MKKNILLTIFALALSYSPLALSGEHKATSDSNANMDSMGKSSSYTKTITNGQYIGGGVTSLFVGFGIGHAIQGRWSERGWIFTVGGVAVVGGLATMLVFLFDDFTTSIKQEKELSELSSGFWLGFGGIILASIALKIWEIVDLWNLPSHYKIVQEPKFQISPVYQVNYKDTSSSGLGLSFKYRF